MTRIGMMRPGRMVALAALGVASLIGRAIPIAAQEVRGIARAGMTGEQTPPPAAETSVVLIDSLGNVVAGTITDEAGRYTLKVPLGGRFRIRARRIGFAPDSSATVSLRRGQSVTFNPVLRMFATRLAVVRVDEAQRCRIAPDAGALALRLWNDAQSALTAAVVASEDHRTGFVLRRRERELAADGSTVLASRTWDSRTLSSEPYASIPAESLSVHGFVVPVGHALVYYAPDARTLITDAFARGHCFRPTARAERPSEIGLAFAPVSAASPPDVARRDVSGVLWLDRATGQLGDMEFTYGPGESSGRMSPAATGRVHYRRLSNGAWIVDHWLIRMPVVTTRTVMAPRAVDVVGAGTSLEPETVASVTAVWEGGGDVVGTFAPSDSTAGALLAFGSVRGRFIDTVQTAAQEARPRGVAGIRVQLVRRSTSPDRTVHVATTDSTGAFAFDRVDPGAYTVRVSGGPIDTLDVVIPERDITVSAATSQSLLTVIPSPAAALRRLCPDALGHDQAAIHGIVRDASGEPAAHARVTIAWFDAPDTRQTHFVASTQTRATLSGPDGTYVVCGVPREHALTVTAAAGALRSAPVPLDPSAATIRLAAIALPARGR